MAYILFVFFLVFGLYVLFSILKNQIVIKNEYYKKKKYINNCGFCGTLNNPSVGGVLKKGILMFSYTKSLGLNGCLVLKR